MQMLGIINKNEYHPMTKIVNILAILFGFVMFISCNTNTKPSEPQTNYKCDTLPSWYPKGFSQRVSYPLRDIVACSIDNNQFVYIVGSTAFYYYNREKNVVMALTLSKVSNNELGYIPIVWGVHNCPYDKNKFLFIVRGINIKDEEVGHWYLFDSDKNIFTKVTPSKYREFGFTEEAYKEISTPIIWLSSSKEGEDLFVTNLGVYHLQKEKYVELHPEDMAVVYVSPNGKYKWHGYFNVKYGDPRYLQYFLNGVKIDSVNIKNTSIFAGRKILWSADSKFIATVTLTDSRFVPFSFFELHIINVEKTLVAGKIVIDKTINLVDSYCCFRAGTTAQYLSNGKVLLSMSYNQKDAGILYEVDIESGKRTPIILD